MPTKKTKKPILATLPYEYKETKLGRAIMEVVENDTSEEAWDNFFTVFLNTPFWMPAIEKINPRTKETMIYPLLDIEKKDKENLTIFEKQSRVKKWHEDHTAEKPKQISAVKFETGYNFVKGVPISMLKKHDVIIDFGKNMFFCPEKASILWLRKMAREIK